MKRLFSIQQQDLGDSVIFEWSPRGGRLAAAGSKRLVSIFDHNGTLSGEIHLAPAELPPADTHQCSCLQLQWDAAGETLAVLPAGCSFVYTWAAASKELQKLDTDFKAQEVSMLAWSRCSSVLAVGTAKGNLQLYHIRERRKVPVMGKHTKRVCVGTWSPCSNVLAMAALDKTLTISDLSGDTLKSVAFRGEPLQLCAPVPQEAQPKTANQESCFSLTTTKKALYIIKGVTDASAVPMELTFMDAYGPITRHVWFGNGYVMVGFKSGQVVVVSSLSNETTKEVHSHRPLDLLQDMAYCPALARVAIGGGSTVKVLGVGAEYGEVPGEVLELPAGHAVERVGWGQGGQVLSVSTSNGLLLTYMASLPSVFAAGGTKHAVLTGLSEVTVADVTSRSSVVMQVGCDPAFISLGPAHLAAGINHQVVFYRHAPGPGQLVGHRSYLGGVQAVCMNSSHAAVLTGGRVLMHTLDAAGGDGKGPLTQEAADASPNLCLPGPGALRAEPITALALSHNFLVTATASGVLSHHVVQDGALAAVNEHRHSGGAITHLFQQPFGPRLVLADDRGTCGLFNPLTDELMPLPDFDGSLQQVLWDEDDPSVFVAANSRGQLYTYLFIQQSLASQRLQLLATASLPSGHTPVLLVAGQLSVRLKGGVLDSWLLDTHAPLRDQDASNKQLQKRLAAAIKLIRMQEALAAARALGSAEAWRQLAAAALQHLDVRLAVAAYRQAGDAAMVMSLASLEGVEDRNLLAGSLLVLLEKDYDQAQELLLRSSRPLAALEMRQDLKHWQRAVALAHQLAPQRVPGLCKEHAAMLELVGEYAEAQQHYQQALTALDASRDSGSEHQQQQQQLRLVCLAGLARTLLHLGDVQAGRAAAQQLDDRALWRECATILEQRHQLQEAAGMYQQAGMAEKAASLYIATRNWAAVAPLMAAVTSAKLQLAYARAKEGEGAWEEAAAAFEAAGDRDTAARLWLSKLGSLDRAAALARASRSAAAAALVAKVALAAGDVRLAIEFLLLGGHTDQAFDMAAAKGELALFGQLAASSAKSLDEAARHAAYLEGRGQPEAAAVMWAQAEQPGRAVSLYVQVCSAASLAKAVEVLEDNSRAPGILGAAPTVVAALDRCQDLAPHARDSLRLRLNMAAGQLHAAAKDALDVARHEQDEGNYKLAHARLVATLQQLHGLGAAAPLEFRRALALLHSYVLVKSLLACGDHLGAAHMLVRVAASISRFPKHVVPILTSTVIECQRAGLKMTALEHACTLMRPEYRLQVAEKYRKKIELMVRKPDRGEEPPEPLTPCPYCHLPGPECQLQCVSCQSIIPFDIATGKRMTLQDWCECPACRMPCSSQGFLAILAAEGKCPMCSSPVGMQDVRQLEDPLATQAART